jgi:hypothetical protein
MKARGLLLATALLGCGAPESATPSSSPLLSMDSDRLWILLQAAKVNPRCRELYAGSTDPRITGLAEKCAATERRVLAWLQANGAGEVEAEHLREAAFWSWYLNRVAQIQKCRSEARAMPSVATSARMTAEASCDPYERLIGVEKRGLADVGIVEPRD